MNVYLSSILSLLGLIMLPRLPERVAQGQKEIEKRSAQTTRLANFTGPGLPKKPKKPKK